LAQTSALAPVYLVVTETAGGAISGYCVTGSLNIASKPNNVINNEITKESIGRLMYFLNINFIF
jgi:hypothetical protein